MALFFMRKLLITLTKPAYFLLIGTMAAGYINQGWLWSVIIIGCLIYFTHLHNLTHEIIESKDKVMGMRLIEGMKALTELCKNAFDHIKTNKHQIEKINTKTSENSSRIKRIEQLNNRIVSRDSTQISSDKENKIVKKRVVKNGE